MWERRNDGYYLYKIVVGNYADYKQAVVKFKVKEKQC